MYTLTERLSSCALGINHVAEGIELMQKEVFTMRPTHALLPPHTPQSSTTLPLTKGEK